MRMLMGMLNLHSSIFLRRRTRRQRRRFRLALKFRRPHHDARNKITDAAFSAAEQSEAPRQGMSRQTSMSYPGQGRPADATGSSQDKAKPEGLPPGRSSPSAQENIHRNAKRAAGKSSPKTKKRS
jgi:hypothetical protein